MANQDDELEARLADVDESSLCEYDRLAIRDLRAGIAHRRAYDRIVSEAYASAAARNNVDE